MSGDFQPSLRRAQHQRNSQVVLGSQRIARGNVNIAVRGDAVRSELQAARVAGCGKIERHYDADTRNPFGSKRCSDGVLDRCSGRRGGNSNGDAGKIDHDRTVDAYRNLKAIDGCAYTVAQQRLPGGLEAGSVIHRPAG